MCKQACTQTSTNLSFCSFLVCLAKSSSIALKMLCSSKTDLPEYDNVLLCSKGIGDLLIGGLGGETLQEYIDRFVNIII